MSRKGDKKRGARLCVYSKSKNSSKQQLQKQPCSLLSFFRSSSSSSRPCYLRAQVAPLQSAGFVGTWDMRRLAMWVKPL